VVALVAGALSRSPTLTSCLRSVAAWLERT
jgi:hypothetical protein